MTIDVFHVVPDGDDAWIVRKPDGGVVDRAFTKDLAVESARRHAKAAILGQLVICLPDGSVEREETFQREPRRSPGSGQRVLVVDDDSGVRSTICAVLRVGGYKAVEAVDGRDAVDAFVHGRFSLVITDLFMPGQDGIETIQRIRELDASIPIIAISGSIDAEYSPLKDAHLMGATRTFPKPFRIEELLSAVHDLTDS